MNRIFAYISLVLSCLFSPFLVLGQDNYDHSLGVRGGNPSGITYKTFLERYTGYEIILGANFSHPKPAITVTGLYEYNHPLGHYTNLYGGLGMTMGGGEKFVWHIDAILGIEYLLSNFPVVLALDYKPMYSLLQRKLGKNDKGFGLFEYGISARYTFK